MNEFEAVLKKKKEILKQAMKIRQQLGMPEKTVEEHLADAKDAQQRAEETRRKYDPNLQSIEKRYLTKISPQTFRLVCPKCGDFDRANMMNGKPWCMRCNIPLVSSDKVELWKKYHVLSSKSTKGYKLHVR